MTASRISAACVRLLSIGSSCLRQAALLLIVGQLWIGLTTEASASDVESTDSTVPMRRTLGAIFADQHVEEAALVVHRRALAMSPEQRFEFLSNWVLPGLDHETFRLAVDFSPTHPAPPVRSRLEEQRVTAAASNGASRVPTGGELISPALDLIHLAAELQRLPELRTKIQPATPRGEIQQRCRLAMLGLVDVALGNFDQALISLDELFARVVSSTRPEFRNRWPETLAVHECLQHEQTREIVTEALHRMLQTQVRDGFANGPPAWDRWVTGSAGRLHSLSFDRPRVSLQNWAPVSRTNQWTRGTGLPNTEWFLSRGHANNITSHDDDFLYYRIPLLGDFTIECDVSSFGWRDSHLIVAGTYVAPIYDHASYGLGTFRGGRPGGPVEPRLTDSSDWIRYRVVVRDGKSLTYFNGRLIHTEPLPIGRDPWLAVRSPSYTNGGVRNLRITGNPKIPEQIQLSTNPDLTGWHAYHGEPLDGDGAYWQYSFGLLSGPAIIGQHEPWHDGFDVERLLQYHRPLLEDGTIEYEFYYDEGTSAVYPALDRQAFVISRDGVRQHWITDAAFDRTGLSPLETTDLAIAPTSLRDNGWNKLRLTLAGDTIELLLNGQSIYQGPVDPANLRTFGLFHWADQTEARVRNIVWRGDWPKTLPPADEQELSSNDLAFLDEKLPELTAVFEHDFAKDGLPKGKFEVAGESAEETVAPDEGVWLLVQGPKGYSEGWLSPNLKLHGDFDVQARFSDFVSAGQFDSSNGIFLKAITTDAEKTHSGIFRGTLRRPDSHDRQIVQCQFNRNRAGNDIVSFVGETAEEATSGTLRLARRGDQLYCLLAENDSAVFRLIHVETVPTVPTIPGGLRLMSTAYSIVDGVGASTVLWQRLQIRAEQITTASE